MHIFLHLLFKIKMFPQLRGGVGKGLAGKAIHEKILGFLPDEYTPIMKTVSTVFNASLPATKKDQRHLLMKLLKKNDIKTLEFYKQHFGWDLSDLACVAIEEECILETIFFLITHDTVNTPWWIEFKAIKANRRDVFLKNRDLFRIDDVSSIFQAALETGHIWPLEWLQANMQDIDYMLELGKALVVVHDGEDQKEHWEPMRSVFNFVLKRKWDVDHGVDHKILETVMFTAFYCCGTSKYASDIDLFLELKTFFQQYYLTFQFQLEASDCRLVFESKTKNSIELLSFKMKPGKDCTCKNENYHPKF